MTESTRTEVNKLLLKILENCIQQNKKAVLATIIDKEGSSYRQVGAKSIILEDGTIHGVISGGCIEEDLYEHAKDVFLTGNPKKAFYDLRNDEDIPWGMGVGCNGAITIWLGLIDPIHQKSIAKKILKALYKWRASSEPFMVGTVIASDYEELLPVNTFLELEDNKWEGKKGILNDYPYIINGTIANTTMYVERITPIPNIIIFGAGQDAKAVVNQMKLLHWQVTVVDHRPAYLTRDNLPNADKLHLVKSGEFPYTLSFNENTYVILMTHHFENDLQYLEGLIQQRIGYIGLLGPKKRFNNLKESLQAKGICISKEVEQHIYTPIGLDIGSETPEEIALSIAAEMMSLRNRATNASLKFKKEALHFS